MLRYGFFDSEITGYDEEGMPIFDRAESSDFLAEFISHIISNGVLAIPGDGFQVVADEGMKLKVRPGFGIIRGRFAMDTKDFGVVVGTASASYKRIDRVILRANYLQRKCEIIVREGTPGTDPALPELIQPESGDYYELCLALVTVNPNQTVITQANITDTRYSDDCGIVTQAIDHLDTSAFSAQMNQYFKEYVEKSEGLFNEWFDSIKKQLSEDAAGNLLGMINQIKQDLEETRQDLSQCPTSAVIRDIQVVDALPGDAAQHPDTLYIIAG